MRTMPFGKYKGVRFQEIPTWYLEWLQENIELREPLKTTIENELDSRDEEDQEPITTSTFLFPQKLHAMAKSIILSGYRNLAKQHHPDHGGSDAAMIELTRAKEALENLIK